MPASVRPKSDCADPMVVAFHQVLVLMAYKGGRTCLVLVTTLSSDAHDPSASAAASVRFHRARLAIPRCWSRKPRAPGTLEISKQPRSATRQSSVWSFEYARYATSCAFFKGLGRNLRICERLVSWLYNFACLQERSTRLDGEVRHFPISRELNSHIRCALLELP